MSWWQKDQVAPKKGDWWQKDQVSRQSADPLQATARDGMAGDRYMEDQDFDKASDQGVVYRDTGGGQFDPSQGIDDFGLRFDTSRSNNPDEYLSKIKAKYPENDARIVTLANGPTVIMKNPETGIYNPLDGSGVDIGDVADFLGALLNEETAAATATTVATKAAPLPARLLYQGLAAMSGNAVRNTVEEMRGHQTDPIEDIFKENLLTGVSGVAGEGTGSLVSRVLNPVRGGSPFKPLAGAENAVKAADAEGFPAVTAGQMHPTFQRWENQSAAVASPVKNYRLSQAQAVKDKVGGLTNPEDLQGLSDQNLREMMERAKQEIYQAIKNPNVELRRGGVALQEGRDAFAEASKDMVRRRYDSAMNAADGATFDLTDVQAFVNEIRQGVLAKGSPIETDAGTIIPKIKVSSDPSGGFLELLNKIRQVDPAVGDFKGRNAAEIMKALRTEAGDFGKYGSDLPNSQQGQARELYKRITAAMENPQGGSEQFNELWKTANKSYQHRRRVLDATDVVKLSRSEAPGALAEQFARPMKFETLQMLKSSMPGDKWRTFTGSFKTKLIRDPSKINKELDAFAKDPDSLKMLLNDSEIKSFRTFGTAIERLNSSTVKQAMEKQHELGKRALTIIDQAPTREWDEFIKMSGNREALKAGVVKNLLDKASVIHEGAETIDPGVFINAVADMKKNPRFVQLMGPETMKTLENSRTYLSMFANASDAGSSIQAGELAAQGVNFLHPDKMAKAYFGIGRNAFMGRLLTNPKFTRSVMGKGKELKPSTMIRLMSVVGMNMATQNERTSQTSSQNERVD